MSSNIRKPAVSGSFYPGNRESLKVMLDSLMDFQIQHASSIGGLLGLAVPHAGYVYSGKTAAAAYSLLKGTKIRRFVLIGPNHSSFPPYTAIYPSGQWDTPLGSVPVDEMTGRNLSENCAGSRLDATTHSHEHSLEVQIPFLQYMLGNDILIIPVIMGDQGPTSSHILAQALLKIKEDFLIIVSSDLNHYETLEQTNRKDRLLIDAILGLDTKKFYKVLEENEISACGYGPIAVLMEYTSSRKGKLELLGHTTSQAYSGDSRNVVGYCSMVSR